MEEEKVEYKNIMNKKEQQQKQEITQKMMMTMTKTMT